MLCQTATDVWFAYPQQSGSHMARGWDEFEKSQLSLYSYTKGLTLGNLASCSNEALSFKLVPQFAVVLAGLDCALPANVCVGEMTLGIQVKWNNAISHIATVRAASGVSAVLPDFKESITWPPKFTPA